jgi:GMP synthase (glutamine-hydrolysing)
VPTVQNIRYLLLQIRNPSDPMRNHEIGCFARVLKCDASRIRVFDLLSSAPTRRQLEEVDMVLLGGSGDYSAASSGPWLDRALDGLRLLHEMRKPTFASCWGFQAMARALGGRVIHDASRAELGTLDLHLTPAGQQDPIFAPLGKTFRGQAGHEDLVAELPPNATLLASSDLVPHQAYCLPTGPIYCTQFHPELGRDDLLIRVRAYPEYVRHIAGLSVDQFAERCETTPETEEILPRFVQCVFGA